MVEKVAFGRPRDDRGPLLFAASLAVLLHVLAVFIPLPEGSEPPVVVTRPVTDTRAVETRLRPPERPEPPDVVVLAAEKPRIPLPFVDTVDPRPDDPPDVPVDTAIDIVDSGTDWSPAEIAPPPDVGIVDQGTVGLIPPVGLHQPPPKFPEVGRAARKPGRVVLSAVIDREGNVAQVEVVFVTQPDLGYSEKAIEAVSIWRFTPGLLRGRAVDVRLTVEVEFELH